MRRAARRRAASCGATGRLVSPRPSGVGTTRTPRSRSRSTRTACRGSRSRFRSWNRGPDSEPTARQGGGRRNGGWGLLSCAPPVTSKAVRRLACAMSSRAVPMSTSPPSLAFSRRTLLMKCCFPWLVGSQSSEENTAAKQEAHKKSRVPGHQRPCSFHGRGLGGVEIKRSTEALGDEAWRTTENPVGSQGADLL